jgi:hypothetical protein
MGQRGGLDRAGHLTIGDRPRFVLGVYASGSGGFSTDPAVFERQFFGDDGFGLRDLPINVVLPYWYGNLPIDATRVLLDVLHAHGVGFLLTCNGFEGGSWRRLTFAARDEGYVRAFAQHPAALGYYIGDELWDALMPETVEHHRQLKAWDPEGISLVALMAGYPADQGTRTEFPPWVASGAADVWACDPYPVYGKEEPAGYPHFAVADYISKLDAATGQAYPTWAVLQFFRASSESRLPTADEMRYHAVASIVEGAEGILWWDVGVGGIRQESPAIVAEYMGHLRALVSELAGLEPALVSDLNSDTMFKGLPLNSTAYADPIAGRIAQLRHNIASEFLFSRIQWYQAEIEALQRGDTSKSGGMLKGAASVRTRASVANGHGVVFAYNYTNQPQPCTLTVPGIEQYHIKVWENRAPNRLYDVAGGIAWSDTFKPYEAKIFVIGQ